MENKRLVTVIVPVYNVELYLERCIQSIMNQTYKNLEIILVNDGSKDSSGTICNQYKCMDNRIQVIHKVNGGLSDARNAGLAVANGEYVSFIDSDDWIELSMIELLLDSIEKSGAEIAIGRRYRIYQDGSRHLETFQTYPKEKCFDVERGLKYLMSFCGYDMSVCDKLFCKKVLQNITFPYGKTCEDSFTTYKIFSQAKRIVYVNQGIYNYFYRENSITRNEKVNEAVIEATREQLAFINVKYPRLKSAAASSYITALISVYNEYIRRDKVCENCNKYNKEARRYLTSALKNNCVSHIKKIQLIVFCTSTKIYRFIYTYSKNDKR